MFGFRLFSVYDEVEGFSDVGAEEAAFPSDEVDGLCDGGEEEAFFLSDEVDG